MDGRCNFLLPCFDLYRLIFAMFDFRELQFVSADGDILWVVGYRIDDRYKVALETKSVFRCELVK